MWSTSSDSKILLISHTPFEIDGIIIDLCDIDLSPGILGIPLIHMKKNVKVDSYKDRENVINEVMNNKNIIEKIRENLYEKDTILEKLNKLNDLDLKSEQYKELYNEVIQVGEYKN